jgi:hypothetical protein
MRTGPTESTPLLRLNLTPPDIPTISLQVPPAQPSAVITSAARVHGPLLAVWYLKCDTAPYSSADSRTSTGQRSVSMSLPPVRHLSDGTRSQDG